MSACNYRADNGYRVPCGRPAEYRVWGDPCSCTVTYNAPDCGGHPVCEGHAITLRSADVRCHRDKPETFRVSRIRSLEAAAS